MIQLKRVYDNDLPDEVIKVLVDRLWPRGIAKKDGIVDAWYKEVSPSTTLRKWFDHDPDKWELFKKKYKAELAGKQGILEDIRSLEREHKKIVLLYAAKDEKYNNAIVLKEVLGGRK